MSVTGRGVVIVSGRAELAAPAGSSTGGEGGLATALAAAGWQVTLLHLQPAMIGAAEFAALTAAFAEHGVTLAALPDPPFPIRQAGCPARRSHALLEWLKAHPCRLLLLLDDHGGAGYYPLLARRLGLALTGTRVVLRLSSPTTWQLRHALLGEAPVPDLVESEFMERQTAALADQVLLADPALEHTLTAWGWPPLSSRVLLPFPPLAPPAAPGHSAATLLFLTRFEAGAAMALHALRALAAQGTGLAGAVLAVPEPLRPLVETALRSVPFPCRCVAAASLGGPETWAPGTVLVIPDESQPFPETAILAAMAGRPVVLPEGISLGSAAPPATQAPLHPQGLARRIAAGLAAPPPLPPEAAQAVRRAWLELPDALPAPIMAATPAATPPLVSVCLTHYRRPALLVQAVESVLAQDYPALEAVLVDDGSGTAEAEACLDRLAPLFAARGWALVRQDNHYLGAARNAAAAAARGDWLLFLDDDNRLKPHAVSRFIAAATALQADIVTCFADDYAGTAPPEDGRPLGRYLPVGAVAALGMVRNCFGDANALVSRRCLTAVGGFTEDRGVGHEDWELFARAVLAGFRLEVVPEALYWYRIGGDGGAMLGSTSPAANQRRSLRPFLEQLDPRLQPLLLALKTHELMRRDQET